MKFIRKAKILNLVVLAMVLFGLAGCGKKEAGSVTADKTVPVTVAEAMREDIIAKTTITGKVTPVTEVVVVPKTLGKVTQVAVDIGSSVKKGSLLAKLDTVDLEISLSSALNGMQSAKLTHNQAILNYNNAKSNYDRMKTLYNDGAISQQQLEQAQLTYNLANDSLNAPIEAIAQNQIDNIRNQISNATITSPIAGEVATRSIDPGEMATPSQPILSIVNIDTVFVEGTVAEDDVALVKEGQKVTVKIDAAGGAFEGIVKLLSPVANSQTKGYPVKIEIKNTNHKMKPGMFAEIQLVTKDQKDAIVIPKDVLVTRGSDKIIYIVNNGIAEERTVTTGIESDDKIEIVKGLNAGEKFVVEGQPSLFNKAKVTVQSQNKGS